MGAELEGLDPVRLDTALAPNPGHTDEPDAQRCIHELGFHSDLPAFSGRFYVP